MKSFRASTKFLKDYRKASPGLVQRTHREVADIGVRVAEHPSTWATSYDRIEGLGRNDILEVDLAGGPRLFLHNGDEAITLLRMGEHDLTNLLRNTDIDQQIAGAGDLPASFHRASFPPESRGTAVRPGSWVEARPEWVFFLSEQQSAVGQRILSALEDDLVGERFSAHFVLGGPGTGKTVVLLWLMQQLSGYNPDTPETWTVRLRASAAVIDLVERASGWDLSSLSERHGDGSTSADVVLLDDPTSLAEVAIALERAQEYRQTLVVAIDALQVDHSVADASYFDLVNRYAVHQERLTDCYRQKAEVGGAAASVIQMFGAFDAEQLNTLLSEIRYIVPAGVVRSKPAATRDDWDDLVAWLAESRPQMWSHWPSILVAIDRQTSLPGGWIEQLRDVIGGDRVDVVTLDDVERIRGVEYQHAVLVISATTSARIAQGLNRPDAAMLNLFRLLRIPFSRPRDSITTLVLDQLSQPAESGK